MSKRLLLPPRLYISGLEKLAIILSLLYPSEIVASNYLGEINQEDPQQLVCVLPANADDKEMKKLEKSSMIIYFNQAFSVISSMNLLTGQLADGYTQTPIQQSQLGSNWFVRITFINQPVPVCLAVTSVQDFIQTFNYGPLQFLPGSYVSVGDATTKFDEAPSEESDQLQKHPGIALFIVSKIKRITASMYAVALNSHNNMVTLPTITSLTPNPKTLVYLDEITGSQALLLAELNAKYDNQRRLSGIAERLFQHLLFNNGIQVGVLNTLITAMGKNFHLKEAVKKSTITNLPASTRLFDSTAMARWSTWLQLLPHLEAFEQQTTYQLLGTLSLPSKEVSDEIKAILGQLEDKKPEPYKDENIFSSPDILKITPSQTLPQTELQIELYFAQRSMTVHQVIPDGNCLPAAIAGAINHACNTKYTQIDVRKILTDILRFIIHFIDTLPKSHSEYELTYREAESLQANCIIAITSLLGIEYEALQAIQSDGSEAEQTGWMEFGLIALLPLLGVDVNVYAPHSPEGLLNPWAQYSRSNWENEHTSRLIDYLSKFFQYNLTSEPIIISLIHNGAHGDYAQAGHYSYVTDNNTPERVQPDNSTGQTAETYSHFENVVCSQPCLGNTYLSQSFW